MTRASSRVVIVAIALAVAGTSPALAQRRTESRQVVRIVRQVMHERHLAAVIVRVDRGRRTVARAALGQSMTGVPARPDMRFRIGSMSIPYLTTVLLQLQETGRLSLDDTVSKWLPHAGYPNADRVTLRMLGHATSGYPDWIQGNPAFEKLQVAHPFRMWTQRQLLRHAFAQPPVCAPGACFHYAHTNFAVLGQVVSKVTGRSFAQLVRRRIFDPLGLRHTDIARTAAIPSPVLHAFGTDRGVYEDTTFWSPSWGLGRGQLMTADIDDVARSAAGVLSGRLLSRRARRELVADYRTAGQQPPPGVHYGLGVVVAGAWRIQNPFVNNYAGVMAYLPAERLSVAIESTKGPRAQSGTNDSQTILQRIAARLSPGHPVNLPG